MKLESILLHNFRLFRHDVEIDFPTRVGRPLTVVRAENRTGKTTLLTAIQWCLYGDEAISNSGHENEDGLLISAEVLHNAKPDEIVDCHVTLKFEHDGVHYIAKRVREVQKTQDGQGIRVIEDGRLTIVRLGATGSAPVPNPEVLKGLMLPTRLRELFFFDGDRINTFMEPGHEESVQDAVSKMLEFELFDDAEKHLTAILADYRTQLRNMASGEAKELRDKQAKLEEAQSKTEAKLHELEGNLRDEKAFEARLTAQLASSPGDVGELEKERERLVNEMKSLQDAQRSIAQELGRQLGEPYFTPFKFIGVATSILEEKRRLGEIPKRIGENLIKERLELGQCICGRPLSPGDEAHKHMLDQLAEQEGRAVIDDLATEMLYYLRSFTRRQPDQLKEHIEAMLRSRTENASAIAELDIRITEIDERLKQLGDVDTGAIKDVIAGLEKTRNRIESILVDIEDKRHKIEQLKSELVTVGVELKRAERVDSQTNALRQREILTERAIEALRKTYDAVRDIERRKISEKTAANFFRMNVRSGEFDRVEVTPSFQLQVIAPEGYVTNSVLSGAQRRALSLAFLLALTEVSEREAPVVVDTPLGMASGEMRRSITETIANHASQLILLLTRSEIQGVEDILNRASAAQVTLTCSKDYPTELVHPRNLPGDYTEVCACGIDQSCRICDRVVATTQPSAVGA